MVEARSTQNPDDIASVPATSDQCNLLLRCLEPTLPNNRFYQLLHQLRFEEAQVLARQFNLDEKLVHEVRVNHVLDRLEKGCSPELLQELVRSLDVIEDIAFVVESCVNATLPSVHATIHALEYAEKRLQGLANEESQELRSRVLCALKRLGTFSMASLGAFDAPEWHRFRQADLRRELTANLRAGRISTAATIWSRHESEDTFILFVGEVLAAIPESLASHSILPWLRHSIYPNLQRQDHAVALEWARQRATILELTEKTSWPQSAIDFLAVADCILAAYGQAESADVFAARSWVPNVHSAHPRDVADRLCGRSDEEVEGARGRRATDPAAQAARSLALLRRQLEDIQFLRTTASLRLSLAEHSQETPESILFALLERVAAADLLPEVVRGEIKPYAARHGCDVDDVLLQYVGMLSGGAQAVAVTGSTWSSRALAVISCLSTLEAKASATLVLMRSVAVPCHPEVEQLIEAAKAWPHHSPAQFDEQYRLLKLKAMMLPYGITNFNMSNLALARGLMRRIVAALDSATAVADALQVVDAYHHLHPREVYVGRIRALAQAGRRDEALSLFASLPPGLMASVGLELLAWCQEVSRDQGVQPTVQHSRQAAVRLCVQCADLMLRASAATPGGTLGALSAHDLQEVRGLHQRYSSLERLQDEFHLLPLPDRLDDPEEVQVCVQAALKSAHLPRNGDELTLMEQRRAMRQLQRVFSILVIAPPEAIRHVALLCSQGQLPMSFATAYCEEAAARSPCPETAAALSLAVEELVRFAANNVSRKVAARLADILMLARLAAAYCDSKALLDAVALFRACELAAAVEAQCNHHGILAGDNSPVLPTRLALVDRQLKIARFSEDGLVLEAQDLMPEVCCYITAVYPSVQRPLFTYQCRRVECRTATVGNLNLLAKVAQTAPRLFKRLSTNRQTQLGLRYALDALGACAQHFHFNRTIPEIQDRYQALMPNATKMVHDMLASLLSSALCGAIPDRATAMGYITGLPLEAAFSAFQNSVAAIKRQFNRLAQLAHVGVGIALLWSETGLLEECALLAKDSSWWYRLSSVGVSFDRRAYEGDRQEYVRQLLPSVIACTHHDLALALELAEAYAIPPALPANIFVEMLCISVDPNVLQLNAAGYPELQTPLQEQLRQLARAAPNAQELCEILMQSCLPLVSPYHYERIAFVLELAVATDVESRYTTVTTTGRLLLSILSLYQRSTPPSATERSALDAARGATVALPGARDGSRVRLPFHWFLQRKPLDTLKPELSLESVARLLPVARLLSLPPDEFYVTVVEKLVPEMATGAPPDRIAAVLDLVRKISDAEMAVGCCKLIADELPLSQGKVDALQLAVKLATERLDACATAVDADKVRVSVVVGGGGEAIISGLV